MLLAVFAGMAGLMVARVLPALLALPLMAVATALIGGVTPADTIDVVVGQGALRLSTAYTVVMFGCMLSLILERTGVAAGVVKWGAELSGDRPWIVGAAMLLVVALLFTTLAGLGAIIMVGTMVIPLLTAVGMGPLTSAGLILFGLSLGGTLNVANWAVYTSVLGLSASDVRPFALIMFGITLAAGLVYLTVQLHRDGQPVELGKGLAHGAWLAAALVVLLGGYHGLLPDAFRESLQGPARAAARLARWGAGTTLVFLFVWVACRALSGAAEQDVHPHGVAYASPLVPLVLIMLFDVHFVAAFVLGLVYAFAATYRPGRRNAFVQALLEGGHLAMPAVILMFGIGMLLVAVMGPPGGAHAYPGGWPVLNLLRPVLESLTPDDPLSYVLAFTLAAPLALYRGPLNVWGMGYGLAAVFLASGMPRTAVMGLLMAVGQVQGISDPTNTHNVWLANQARVDVQAVLWNTLPYTWAISLAGLSASALLYL